MKAIVWYSKTVFVVYFNILRKFKNIQILLVTDCAFFNLIYISCTSDDRGRQHYFVKKVIRKVPMSQNGSDCENFMRVLRKFMKVCRAHWMRSQFQLQISLCVYDNYQSKLWDWMQIKSDYSIYSKNHKFCSTYSKCYLLQIWKLWHKVKSQQIMGHVKITLHKFKLRRNWLCDRRKY